jgi:trk system potassium uptake protein TrkH
MSLRAGGAQPLYLVVGSFAALILVGTLLLRLPAATPPDQPIGWVDALFTSTSATCVTGLAVRDTGTGFTFFGQAVILGLIQLGGLGVLTLSMVILVAVRGRFSLLERALCENTVAGLADQSNQLGRLLRHLFRFTFVTEAIGALVLFLHWRPRFGTSEALWQAVFHAVSAFCNAGFGLWPDSLVRWQGDAVVNATIMVLIVLGGIGFLVVFELENVLRRDRRKPASRGTWRRLSLHTRLVLVVTALLVFVGAAAIWAVERDGMFQRFAPGDAWLASLFQSVTARTAGFNSVDIGLLQPATLFVIMLLMFVGGSPGSCAGGIKTTSLGVLALAAWSRLRGRSNVNAFGRTVSKQSLEYTLVIVVVAVLGFLFGLLLMLLADPPRAEGDHARFLALTFETISALATVGLSCGITADLPAISKLVLTGMMFAGRLGALTLATSLAREDAIDDWRHPEEAVMVG